MSRLCWGGVLLSWVLAALPTAGVAGPDASRLPVVASFTILADMVREVGGDAVTVAELIGADGDAHVYEPGPQDVVRLKQAKVLVSNGLGFEPWLPRLQQAAGFSGVSVEASTGVPLRRQRHLRRSVEVPDPHAWQDVRNALAYVENIADGLVRADPANAAGYRARADDYTRRLRALDQRIRQALADLPVARRSVVVSHDAFGYYGAAYGLRFVPVHGFLSGPVPAARDIARLADRIRSERIPALFVENIADPRLMAQLARETGAVMGGRLFSDALSGADGPASSYIRMMEANTARLATALSAAPISRAP